MRNILAVVCGVLLSTVLVIAGSALVAPRVSPIQDIQLTIFLLAGIFGPLAAGFIARKKGWFLGATTVVISETLQVICFMVFVTNTFSPSDTQIITIVYMAKREIQLFLCAGLAVFMGSLMGLLGEKIGMKVIGHRSMTEDDQYCINTPCRSK